MLRRKYHGFSIWEHFNAGYPRVRSGLLGPVNLAWLHDGHGGVLINASEQEPGVERF